MDRIYNTKPPPVYTFQRPKRMPRLPSSEAFTKVELEDDTSTAKNLIEQHIKYTRYSFFILVIMFIMMICGMIYTFKKGLPVRLR